MPPAAANCRACSLAPDLDQPERCPATTSPARLPSGSARSRRRSAAKPCATRLPPPIQRAPGRRQTASHSPGNPKIATGPKPRPGSSTPSSLQRGSGCRDHRTGSRSRNCRISLPAAAARRRDVRGCSCWPGRPERRDIHALERMARGAFGPEDRVLEHPLLIGVQRRGNFAGSHWPAALLPIKKLMPPCAERQTGSPARR